MSINFQKRFFTQHHKFVNPVQRFPWNFYAVPERREVGNLTCAIPIKQLLSYKKIVALFKQFIESIEQQDFDLLTSISEPSFCEEAKQAIQTLHSQDNLELKVENLRSFKSQDVFLYDVQNLFLVGTDIPEKPLSLNRKTNLPRFEYIQSFDEEVLVKQAEGKSARSSKLDELQQFPVKVSTISQNTTKVKLKPESKILFVSRLNLMIHSYINIYGVNNSNGESILGQKLPEKITISNQGAHFMTLDRIVQEMTVADLQLLQPQQKIKSDSELQRDPKPQKRKSTIDKSFMISDFDFFMPEGNPIVKL